MAEIRRLDGKLARQWELLTSTLEDLRGAAALAARVLDEDVPHEDREIQACWINALVRYGRCFAKGARPSAAPGALDRLPTQLQRRHRHFRRLWDMTVSRPGGAAFTHTAVVVLDADRPRHIHGARVPMLPLGRLEAMDFLEMIDAVQRLMEQAQAEIENSLQEHVIQMPDHALLELPRLEEGVDR